MVAVAVFKSTVNTYGDVPPEAVKVPVPSSSLLHNKVTSAVGVFTSTAGSVMVIVCWAVQPLASVMVTVTTPGAAVVKLCTVAVDARIVAVAVFASTVKVYGDVPPEAVKLPVPSSSPLHNKVTSAVGVFTSIAGSVMVIVCWAVQTLASVMVTVTTHGAAAVKSWVEAP